MEEKKLQWSRLKVMKCPDCSKAIVREVLKNGFKCSKCDFFISMEKFNQLVAELYQPKKIVDNYQDNQEELNNL